MAPRLNRQAKIMLNEETSLRPSGDCHSPATSGTADVVVICTGTPGTDRHRHGSVTINEMQLLHAHK
jgi:hypothetical protein